MENFTTIAEVDRIAAMNNAALRNEQITRSYYQLSLAFSKHTGPWANWCTFATWASRQAGQTIRGEDFAAALEARLRLSPAISQAISRIAEIALLKGAAIDKEGLLKLIWETIDPKGALDRASIAVGRGNRKVFAEIAREFARFLAAFDNDTAHDAAKIAGFCAVLKPGAPPEGQQYLVRAFSHYYQAFFEKDAKNKAELILLANIEIGFHEQTRLQPEIAEALEAAVVDPVLFKANLLAAIFPRQGWISALGDLFRRLFGWPTPLDRAIGHLTTLARHHIRLMLTKHLMELQFPQKRLKLGDDLDVISFPPLLKTLTHPELITLLAQIDPTPNSVKATGAIDWADLYDRLHFIADMFRCYQEDEGLFLAP